MSQYELIAFDMDGTLLNSVKQLSPGNLEYINKAAAAGKLICLSTGRCPAELTEFEQELANVRYFISSSGALVYENHTHREIAGMPLKEADVKAILDVVRNEDLMIHFLSWKSVVQADKIPNMERYHMAVYRPMYERVAVRAQNVVEYYEQDPFPVYKLNLYCTSKEQRAAIEEKLKPLGLCLVYAEGAALECTSPGVSKGVGLKLLCEAINMDVQKTVAVGDADNDLEILRAAGLAVAMGNANDHVKAEADVIVADNDHDGCAEAIANYLLK